MSALPRIPMIVSKPIQRPIYVQELANVNAFVRANLEALRLWFGQLTAFMDHGMSWDEFCRIQYDIEVESAAERAAERFERQCDRDERDYDRQYDRDTGIRRYGEI